MAFGGERTRDSKPRRRRPGRANLLLDYEPVRVDLSEPEQTITELMMKAITEAAAVLADLTHARPSVYFEVGYAHGLGVPLVLTCRQDHERGDRDDARVHFDLEQYKISYWSRTSKNRFRWEKGMKPATRLASIIPPRTVESEIDTGAGEKRNGKEA